MDPRLGPLGRILLLLEPVAGERRRNERSAEGSGGQPRQHSDPTPKSTAATTRQLDRPGCAPKLGPALFCLRKPIMVEVMVPVRGSERCPDPG